MLWLKILFVVLLAAAARFFYLMQEEKKAAVRSQVLGLDLHQSCGLNDQAVSAVCNRLARGQSNVAALLEIIAVTRNHIASLEGHPSGKNAEGTISKTFFVDAQRIYKTTAEEAGLLQGLRSYIYNEPVSPEEVRELKERLRKMEAAFEKPMPV